jgi:hypothetical protein
MSKESAITIRVPTSLKKKLEVRARNQRRSLSAQVVFDLENLTTMDSKVREGGSFLGKHGGLNLPSEEDIREVRSLLWGRLKGD